jgi:hypothetical protein
MTEKKQSPKKSETRRIHVDLAKQRRASEPVIEIKVARAVEPKVEVKPKSKEDKK